jgi:hypothetical protein
MRSCLKAALARGITGGKSRLAEADANNVNSALPSAMLFSSLEAGAHQKPGAVSRAVAGVNGHHSEQCRIDHGNSNSSSSRPTGITQGPRSGHEQGPEEGPEELVESQLQKLYARLARAADFSHQKQHGYFDLAAAAKSNLELDRSRSMQERGYSSRLVRLLQPQLTAKSDVIVGVPCSWDQHHISDPL